MAAEPSFRHHKLTDTHVFFMSDLPIAPRQLQINVGFNSTKLIHLLNLCGSTCALCMAWIACGILTRQFERMVSSTLTKPRKNAAHWKLIRPQLPSYLYYTPPPPPPRTAPLRCCKGLKHNMKPPPPPSLACSKAVTCYFFLPHQCVRLSLPMICPHMSPS